MTSTSCSCRSTHLEALREACQAAEKKSSALIPLLQKTQEIFRYLPQDALDLIAESLGLSPARVYGVATFYSHFALSPKGRYVFRMCDGTACHVKGTPAIVSALRKRLNLGPGEHTTPDLEFTVETVNCVGACGLAPVLLVNEEVYGQISPEQAVAVVDKLLAQGPQTEEEDAA